LVIGALGATAIAAAPAHAITPSIATHRLGALPSLRLVAPPDVGIASELPDAVDLREWAMPIGDQGAVGSCVTWAIDYAMLGWYAKKTGRDGAPFAPMYTYSQIMIGDDGGSYPTDAMRVAMSQGSDTKAHYSHDEFDYWDKPTQAERDNAAYYKIAGYHTLFSGTNQVGNAQAIKAALASEHPVSLMIPVRHGFDYLGSDPGAVDNDSSTDIRGWHEVLAVAYDRAGVIIQNSWGTYWGDAGFGRMSWDVIQHDAYEADTIDGFAPPSAPSVSTPAVVLLGSGSTAAGTVPYRISWTGSPGASGPITSYHVTYTRDDNAPVAVSLSSATATSFTLNAQVGHAYRVYVTAHAGDDYVSTPRASAPFAPTLVQDNDARLKFWKRWTGKAWNTSSGKSFKYTGDSGGAVTLTATGQRFAWVTSPASNRGSARVYIDGKLITGVNTYSPTSQVQRIVFAKNYDVAGTHTIQIVNSATAGHPYVDLDAFVVSS
jgi:hypothetical protein